MIILFLSTPFPTYPPAPIANDVRTRQNGHAGKEAEVGQSEQVVRGLAFAALLQQLTLGASITSYQNRPNDAASVAEYLRTHFMLVYRKHSDPMRQIYTHMTSAIVRRFWYVFYDQR